MTTLSPDFIGGIQLKAAPKPKAAPSLIRVQMAERIARLRTHKGLSQLEVAAAMDLTDATISMWEQAKTEPSLDKIKRLADILMTTPEYLAFGVTYTKN